MKYLLLVVVVAASLTVSGCMTGYTTLHRDRESMSELDTLTPPPMTINDVIALSQDSVSPDIIISQMKATGSYFRLSTDDILALRKAGVNDRVINAMIQTGNNPPERRTRSVVVPYYYPYWWYSSWYYPYYWYRWYSPFYFGTSYRVGHFGGYHPGAFHYSGARSGNVRSSRTHR